MRKSVRVIYSRVAEKDLSRLPKEAANRILKKIAENTTQSNVLTRAKALSGQFAGRYRYRVGDYRVVFIVDEKSNVIVLTILNINIVLEFKLT